MRWILFVFLLASAVRAQDGAPWIGVDVRDVATRHFYNPFDGLMLDRNTYPPELIDDAEALLSHLEDGGEAALGLGALSSVRVMGWTPGTLEVAALARGKPRWKRATFVAAARAFTAQRDAALLAPSLYISLQDLTLALRSADGAIALVDPIGAGGYKDEARGTLMTPAMHSDVTRTPGRAWMPASRYKGNARGGGYMIPKRTHPDYYEGLPFVRLRRFDQGVDEYGIHGPVSRSGTFPLPPRLPGEKLANLKRLAPRLSRDPEALSDQLLAEGLVDPDTRLVRGRISNGCIRLRARDIRELYTVLDNLPDGAPVTVAYAPDPQGAGHPFPWETRRFAIATDEKDEDGLTVMFTGEQKTKIAGQGRESLPWPADVDLQALEAQAARGARAVVSGQRSARDWGELKQALARN